MRHRTRRHSAAEWGTVIAAVILTAIFAVVFAATADAVELEPGATFHNDGSCTDADGSPGLSTAWGECVTTADYDARFSVDNLDTVASVIDSSTQSIAAEAGLVDTGTPASERPRELAGVTYPTFADVVLELGRNRAL